VFSTDTPEECDGTELTKGRLNSFFLILLSYGWWGAGAVDTDSNEIQPAFNEWKSAVQNLDWVLE